VDIENKRFEPATVRLSTVTPADIPNASSKSKALASADTYDYNGKTTKVDSTGGWRTLRD